MQSEVPQTLLLNRSTLQSLLTMLDVNQAIEDAFLAYGNGHWEVPAKIIFSQAQYDGDFGAMPAYCHEPEYIAIKWGGVHNRNPQIGLPTTLTQIILSDPQTAWPLAIAEGAWITEMRTGAAAGIATKYMARPDAGLLAVNGAGAGGRRVGRCNWDKHIHAEHRDARKPHRDKSPLRPTRAPRPGSIAPCRPR